FTSDNAPFWAFHLLEDDLSDLPGCFPQGGKFGFIDKTGRFVIDAKFFVAQDFSEGLAAVEETVDSKYGYIDRTGRMVIEPRFNQAMGFSEGLAAVETSARIVGDRVVDIAWGFIDKGGVLKIPDKYDSIPGGFSEGLAPVTIRPSGNMGYIDHDGKLAIPAQFTVAWGFSDGLAATCSAGRCAYIDRAGKVILKDLFAKWSFIDGLAVISTRDRRVYIDKRGRVIAAYSDVAMD
ncbi:MAG TPA: WG repeat-containing protein, partial [Terriglobia bacterium]|nr:WG repeat-containing protein [Terriglobia bacterium]